MALLNALAFASTLRPSTPCERAQTTEIDSSIMYAKIF